MESKQDILDALTECLKLTRDQHDLEAMIYDDVLETVTVAWQHGAQIVNVACDSGIAMIRDVLNAIR